MIHVWSLDDGYGDLKGENGKSNLLIPSYSTFWRPKPKSDLIDDRKDPFSYITVVIDDQKFIVGKGAIEQDMRIEWTGGDNKHLDKGFPVLLKTCLAILANNEKNVVVEPLVMGLPGTAEENEERHKLLEKIVCGHHEAKVELADGRVFHSDVFIKELVVKKQPFGSFCDVVLDKTGDIKDKVVASQFNIIVDIGARTLNIYTLNALDPIADLCDTTNHGVYTAYSWVARFIEDKLSLPVPSGKIPSIIEKGEIRGIDLREVINRSYEMLANDIARIINTMFVDSWVFVDRIIFTGGGSEVLRTWLEREFAHRNHMFLDRFATARGLRKYGVRHARNKRGVTSIALPGGGAQLLPKAVK